MQKGSVDTRTAIINTALRGQKATRGFKWHSRASATWQNGMRVTVKVNKTR